MPTLLDVLAAYSVLESLPPWLTAKDLVNLGLTCKTSWGFIGGNTARLDKFASRTRCAGSDGQPVRYIFDTATDTLVELERACADAGDQITRAMLCIACGKPTCNVSH